MSTLWVERTRAGERGATIKWRERQKPGRPGVFERHYLIPEERTSTAVGTCGVSYGGEPFSTSPTGSSIASGGVRSVYVTKYAKRHLDREDIDGLLEVGGGAFGVFDRDSGELTIDAFTGRAYDNGEGSCRLDSRFIDQQTERQREVGLALCGTWHLHPSGTPLSPSAPDKACWRSWARHNGGNPFVGLIVDNYGSIAAFTEHGEQLHVHVEPPDWY
jgi:hypothetical protein